MTHALEGLKSDSQYTPQDLIEAKVTALMSDMWVAQTLVQMKEWKMILAEWQTELGIIRTAVRDSAPSTEEAGDGTD